METDEAVDVDAHLEAGVALYDEGRFHAAHDPWEAAWLRVREDAPDDADLLQGLIQTTAAVHHAREGNAEGARGLAASAREYLADLPADLRGVDLATVRAFLPQLERDPLTAGDSPPALLLGGRERTLPDLEFPAAGVAAVALAEDEGLEEAVVERAVEYAWRDLEESPTSPFVDAVLAFVAGGATDGEGAPLAVAYDRLRQRVQTRDAREADVEGLFD